MLTLKEFKDIVILQTKLMQTPTVVEQTKMALDGLSEKAKKVYNILSANRAPAYIYELMATILEEDIPVTRRLFVGATQGFYPLSCVVPLRNPNSHNYTIGEPCVVTYVSNASSNKALRMDGKFGNNLPAMNINSEDSPIVPASEEQTTVFFDRIAAINREIKLSSLGKTTIKKILAGERVVVCHSNLFD